MYLMYTSIIPVSISDLKIIECCNQISFCRARALFDVALKKTGYTCFEKNWSYEYVAIIGQNSQNLVSMREQSKHKNKFLHKGYGIFNLVKFCWLFKTLSRWQRTFTSMSCVEESLITCLETIKFRPLVSGCLIYCDSTLQKFTLQLLQTAFVVMNLTQRTKILRLKCVAEKFYSVFF